MSYDLCCRLCLSTENLKPIFEDLTRCERYSLVLSLTTGLKVELNDGFPQTICSECTKLVNSALALRNTSHKTQINLRKIGFKLNIKTDIHKLVKKHVTSKKNNVKKVENHDYEESSKKDHVYDNTFESEELSDLEDRRVSVKFDRLTAVKDKKQHGGTDDEVAGAKIRESEPVIEDDKEFETEKELHIREKRDLYLSFVDGVLDHDGPIKCKACKKTLAKWSTFIHHLKLHLGFRYVCEYCGKSFVSMGPLNRHCRSHHGMERQLACPQCDYMAIDSTQLVHHERRVHTGERPYVCDTCGSSYFSRRCLIQHIDSHLNVKSVQCDKCEQMFKSRRHLSRHTFSAHTSKQFLYKCPVCSQVYRNYKYVRVHLRKVHELTTKDVKIVKIKL